jgi:hypothetical protein
MFFPATRTHIRLLTIAVRRGLNRVPIIIAALVEASRPARRALWIPGIGLPLLVLLARELKRLNTTLPPAVPPAH